MAIIPVIDRDNTYEFSPQILNADGQTEGQTKEPTYRSSEPELENKMLQ